MAFFFADKLLINILNLNNFKLDTEYITCNEMQPFIFSFYSSHSNNFNT